VITIAPAEDLSIVRELITNTPTPSASIFRSRISITSWPRWVTFTK